MPRTIDERRHRKDPTGRYLCVWCGQPCPPGHARKYCSPHCEEEYLCRRNPGYWREAIFKRDHGVCARCGRDTEALKKLAYDTRRRLPSWSAYAKWMRDNDWPDHRHSLWDAHHKVAISDGGESTLENGETLCYRCHREETRLHNSKPAAPKAKPLISRRQKDRVLAGRTPLAGQLSLLDPSPLAKMKEQESRE